VDLAQQREDGRCHGGAARGSGHHLRWGVVSHLDPCPADERDDGQRDQEHRAELQGEDNDGAGYDGGVDRALPRQGDQQGARQADGQSADEGHEVSRRFTARSTSTFSGRCFPDDVIALALRWYTRYRLRYADVWPPRPVAAGRLQVLLRLGGHVH
jgi:hypothetical protein